MQGKTVIAIAHRLSTIAAMDRLIVMDGGHIVEEGTHAQLLAQGGIYARLWAHQSGGVPGRGAAQWNSQPPRRCASAGGECAVRLGLHGGGHAGQGPTHRAAKYCQYSGASTGLPGISSTSVPLRRWPVHHQVGRHAPAQAGFGALTKACAWAASARAA